MQIDANDAVLYMQISHATTLWLLSFGGRRTPVSVFVDVFADARVYLFMFGWMSGPVCVKRATSEGFKKTQSILRLL